MICVVIARTRHKMMNLEAQEAAKNGAPMVELRLDYLAKSPDFKRLLDKKACPIVATIRRPEDGGRWGGTEEQRLVLLRQATVAGFDWIDIETDIADQVRRFGSVKRIVSYHNMHKIPDDLEQIYEKMCAQDADVIKIAVMGQNPGDNTRVLNIMRTAPKPTVAFCMGDFGFPSRILGAKFKAPFTYCVFSKERSPAPAIPSYADLTKLYFYERMSEQTVVYGVIGDPVGHSLSPVIHNRLLRKMGFNAVYLPFRVPSNGLKSFLQDSDKLPVYGYSVTIPHKEGALALARVKDPEAVLVKAANTLLRRPDGFHAHNTDAPAAHASLLEQMPIGVDGKPVRLADWTVLLLGAGGAARALAHVLKKENANLVIANRTVERAQKLAEEVGCRSVVWADRHTVTCDLLVNCTSVGMHPNTDEMPVQPTFFKPGMMVFETIYTPERTMLVKEAQERNCRVLTGVDMFARQAALQFKLFTGEEVSLDVVHEQVRRALSPLSWRGEH